MISKKPIKLTEEERLIYKIIEKRIPRARVFVLNDNEQNVEYERLLRKIADNKCILLNSSGSWHDGCYYVQMHYWEIEYKKVKREDVDTDNLDKKDEQKKEKDEDDTKDYIKDIEERNTAFEFDTINIEEEDGNEDEEKSLKQNVKKNKKTHLSKTKKKKTK